MKRQPVVLIVDDAKDNREGYAQYLQLRGFSTLEAATGEEALKLAQRAKPDAILLDLRLPGLSGMEVSRRLRAAGFHDTAIIALSACTFEADIAAAKESGCDSFLSKPCLPEAVVGEIRRLLKTRRAAS